ncbi:sigma-70 family RNA polymerase sigma factor [Lacrimispora xylanisolvens]|uniref:sigma-70 family RNA polymerase sigma factor n=1 Tax=Lacrimispora xylanisolvens TaxID=384636 RepID=UPI002402CB2C
MSRNCETREQERTVSYSALSEEWQVLETREVSALERLIHKETVSEILAILTNQQRMVICRFFLEQKTQRQISRELGITAPAVSRILSRAIQRARRYYSYFVSTIAITGDERRV